MDEKIMIAPAEGVSEKGGKDFLPAIVSIRMQEFRDLYDTEEGFGHGTVFAALNKPFTAGGM